MSGNQEGSADKPASSASVWHKFRGTAIRVSRPENIFQAPVVATPSPSAALPSSGPSSTSCAEKATSSDKVGAWNKVVVGNQPPALSTLSLASGVCPPEPHVGVALGASEDCRTLAKSLKESSISGPKDDVQPGTAVAGSSQPKKQPAKVESCSSPARTTVSKKVAAAMKTSERPLRKPERGPIQDCDTISLYANHFGVKICNNLPEYFYHYDVTISPVDRAQVTYEAKLPDKLKSFAWQAYVAACPHLRGIATPFDGVKNMYSAKQINFDGNNCHVQIISMRDPDDPERTRSFEVAVKLVSTVASAPLLEFMRSRDSGSHKEYPQDVIQALDVALRYSPSGRYTVVNRTFFSPPHPERRHILNNQLELWSGHFQSLTVGCDNNATLNIDLATKAFYQGVPLIRFLKSILDKDLWDVSTWTDRDVKLASEALKGKLIAYGTGPRRHNGEYANEHAFTAVRIIKQAPIDYMFGPAGNQISIVDHFEAKNTRIDHPNYPCVHIGSVNQTNYVPLELCKIVPQAYRGKMDKALTAKMIKGAAVGPRERFQRILNSRMGCRFEECSAVRDFGLQVDNRYTTIPDAKRFHGPLIKTNENGTERPNIDKSTGSWNYGKQKLNPAFVKFFKPATVPKFGVLTFEEIDVRRFVNAVQTLGTDMGMKFSTKFNSNDRTSVAEIRHKVTPDSIRNQLQRLKSAGCQLVFVILGADGREYSMVKAEAEVQVGILTTCMRSKNAHACQTQTMNNFLLKLNSKLNGTNWIVDSTRLQLNRQPTIIFGADVTHPAPNSKAPSIAAVTASYDLSGMCFNMHIQPQGSRVELIVGIAGIVKRNIEIFLQKTGKLPVRLIMFRDGVSEGYFDQIKAEEYEQIKMACEEVSSASIKITFVVVKKRHHTRFQPVNEAQGVGRYRNVPPGTVVDTVLVHPTEQEFFLNSHVGIQGTSKPTRYHVIHDDCNFTMSEIERLTYHLCYAYIRCTQPVSYPAATYYAHLAAYRARLLVEKEGENADLAQLSRKLTIHPDLVKNYPFFYV